MRTPTIHAGPHLRALRALLQLIDAIPPTPTTHVPWVAARTRLADEIASLDYFVRLARSLPALTRKHRAPPSSPKVRGSRQRGSPFDANTGILARHGRPIRGKSAPIEPRGASIDQKKFGNPSAHVHAPAASQLLLTCLGDHTPDSHTAATPSSVTLRSYVVTFSDRGVTASRSARRVLKPKRCAEQLSFWS
jgi:hypothetical protein